MFRSYSNSIKYWFTKFELSIIVPVYNGESFIEGFLDNIRAQQLLATELIFVDDGSVDKTQLLFSKVSHNLNIPIKYFKKTNGGTASAINFGIKRSQGKYILPLDIDDKLNDSVLSQLDLSVRDEDIFKFSTYKCSPYGGFTYTEESDDLDYFNFSLEKQRVLCIVINRTYSNTLENPIF